MSVSSPSFQPYCPQGGTWYACGNGAKFTGCCTSNPCNSNGCSTGNLRPASFHNLTAFGQFPDQVCEAGQWWACKTTNPSFLGCCASNPCQQNGCPPADLKAAFLSSITEKALAFDPQPPLPGTSATSVQSSSSPTPTSTTSATSTPSTSTTSSSPSIAVIAGGAVGGLAVLLILVSIFFVLRRRHKAKKYYPAPSNDTDKTWLTPAQPSHSPYLDEVQNLPVYSLKSNSPRYPTMVHSPSGSIAHIPQEVIHEAGSRELTYAPYSNQYASQLSPTWQSDRMSGSQSEHTSGLGVRGVNGNGQYSRAELG